MEDAVIQVAIQVPAILVLGYVFSSVLKTILNEQARRIDRMADTLEKLAEKIKL